MTSHDLAANKMELSTWIVLYIVGSSVLFYLVTYLIHGRKYQCDSKERLDGKTVLITGGSNGIGRATAVNLAQRGARIILCSSQELRGSVAAQQIRGETGNAEVVYYQLDLADTNSIRQFASRVYQNELRLDIIINNAGIAQYPKKTTVDGYEAVFGVNYLGHFLLTYLLLELMQRSGGGRVINVSSVSHIFVHRGLDFKVFDKTYNHFLFPYLSGYETSKLALVVMAREVARRYADYNIIAISCHPGLVLTPLWKATEDLYGKYIFKFFKLILKPFWTTPEIACQCIVYCAVSEKINEITGKFIKDGHPSRENQHSLDALSGTRLWHTSLFLTGCSAKLTLQQNLDKRLDPTLTRRTVRDPEWWELYSKRKEVDPNEKQEIKRK